MFNKLRGMFNNNYNNDPISEYNNNATREESFIRKYIIFRINGRIFGIIFVLLILFSFSARRNNSGNYTVTNNSHLETNSSYTNNSSVTNNSSYINTTITNSTSNKTANTNTNKNTNTTSTIKNTIKNSITSTKNNAIDIDFNKIKNAIQAGINEYNKQK